MLVLIGFLVLVGAAVGKIDASAPEPSTTPKASPARPTASAPAQPAPMTTVPAPAPADPASVTRAAILRAIGRSNREGSPNPTALVTGKPGEEVDVTFPADDNLTNGMIVTGMAVTVENVLKVVQADATWNYGMVRVSSTFPMTDSLGNTREETIFSAQYRKATVDQINFSGFSYRNVGAIGMNVYEDPTVAQKLN